MYLGEEERFFDTYGSLFMSKYPNIELEIVSPEMSNIQDQDLDKQMDDWIKIEKPDVLMPMNVDQFIRHAAEGKFYPLDAVIRQDRFDLSGLAPSIVQFLRDKGGGSLYALGPVFHSVAMYYNKDLFDKYGIAYPKNRMTWEKAFELASKFSSAKLSGSTVYGLQYRNGAHPYVFIESMGGSYGLDLLDPQNKKVTAATDGWRNVIQMAAAAYHSGALYLDSGSLQNNPSFGDPRSRDPFLMGESAMAIDDVNLLNLLKEKELKNQLSFEWGLATVPVGSKHEEIVSDFLIMELFAINAQSENLRAAWEFVKYIHGNEYARIKTETQRQLFTRVEYSQRAYGVNLEPFYALKLSDASFNIGYIQLPRDFRLAFRSLVQSEIAAAFNGSKSIEDALNTIQNEGQAALDKALQQELPHQSP
jgi:multiple sugar transport system substrate-binding protein